MVVVRLALKGFMCFFCFGVVSLDLSVLVQDPNPSPLIKPLAMARAITELAASTLI